MTEKTERKDEESSRSRNINKIDFKNIDDDADDFGAAKFKTEVLSSRKINFNSDEEDADEEDNSGMDVDDSLSEEVPPSPEPFKTPVSRTLSRTQAKASPLVSPSSPSQSPLRLSTRRTPSFLMTPSPTQPQSHVSIPKPGRKSLSRISEIDSLLVEKKEKSVNTNPWVSPVYVPQTSRKRPIPQYSSTPNPTSKDFGMMERPLREPKRIRVADFNVNYSRFQDEFMVIGEVASGDFGCVMKVIHRFDGAVYAIKISKKNLDASRHDEKMAMNEVFAHAALIKHKHFVRYYSSWVEEGNVYIQNEFCHGGSLSRKITDLKQLDLYFSESKLKKLMLQVLKGLHYIHNKQLVHLDIKPDNILLATEEPGFENEGNVDFKIGDLGHVTHVDRASVDTEEGDCRYMAPELYKMKVSPRHLKKADIFSLGLTLYEAGSLKALPKNSLDVDKEDSYASLRSGKLPYLSRYSEKFNKLITSMVSPDVNNRPDTTQLLAVIHPKCNLSYNWGIESLEKSDSSASNDTSLEEVGDSSKESFLNNSKMDLIKAEEKIFLLENELRSRDSQISKLNASLERADISMKDFKDSTQDSKSDEKIENLLKEESFH